MTTRDDGPDGGAPGGAPGGALDGGGLCRIEATAAAVAALDRLRTEHGDVVLHLPGGAEAAGSPMCLPAGELRIGPRDILLGSVHGVEMYEQRSRATAHHRAGWTILLDLVAGHAPGFSLIPAEGQQFSVRDRLPS